MIEKNLIKEIEPLIVKNIVYEKKTIISNQDEMLKNVLILLEGTIKLTHVVPSGKELTLGVYGAKRIVLSNFFSDKNFISLFRIQTLSICKIGIVPIKKVLLIENLNFQLIEYYDSLLQKIYLQMRDLLLFDNDLKLMSVLIRLTNSYGIKMNDGKIKIDIELNNIILSEYIGCAPETISRLVKNLILKGIVERDKNKLIVKNISLMKYKLNCSSCRIENCTI